jgi:excisionase family DNA binding protein
MSAAKKMKHEEFQFFSLQEVADRTSYHKKTIEKYVKAGRLKTVKINGRRLVSIANLKEFLEAGLQEGELDI